MNEVALSNNLAQIELEINHHKQIAGQSIWEIGRRLNHVKEHDLAHGQFMEWYQSLGIDKDFASKSMKIAKELPNFETLRNLGTTALHLIATLPDEEKQTQLDRIENGDSPTVRELQEVKRQLKLAQTDNERLKAQNENLAEQALSKLEPKIVEKEVIKEVVPGDYEANKALNKSLLERNKGLYDELQELEKRYSYERKRREEYEQERAEVDSKSAKYDELTKAIKESEGELNAYQTKITDYKKLLNFLTKGNEFLANYGGIVFLDQLKYLQTDNKLKSEFELFASSLSRLSRDVNSMLGEFEIIEGETV